MGGSGSGEHFRSLHYRYTDEDCFHFTLGQIELRKYLFTEKYLDVYSELVFEKNYRVVFIAECRIIKQKNDFYLKLGNTNGYNEIYITLTKTGKNYGYPSMHCPRCGRVVKKLFLKRNNFSEWQCFHCNDLIYASSKFSSKPTRFQYSIANRIGCKVELVNGLTNYGIKLRRATNKIIETIIKEKNEMQQTTIKLSSLQLKELDKLSKKKDIARSELIRRAIDEYLAKLDEIEYKRSVVLGKQ